VDFCRHRCFVVWCVSVGVIVLPGSVLQSGQKGLTGIFFSTLA